MAERLVALHGFTQTHHHMHPFAVQLAARHGFGAVTTPDLPGHGLSGHDRSSFDEVVTALRRTAGGGVHLGYSMGGRFALATALGNPDVTRLILIGATAGIDDGVEAAERRRADEARAAQIERDGVPAFVDEWLRLPMFAGLPHDPTGLEHRCRNTAAGLAHSLRTAGTGSMPSLWDRLDEVHAPTLVIAGERDGKFCEIGRRLAERLPHAEFHVIAGAGHAAHAERTHATADLISTWLADLAQ